ncbi:hypothetical protein [Bradyrhizobium sp. NBAIM14]|uniref:hypothetical protein n=1 Tax=Bradyrhizobium sp. NBAIM14 TaxID=2793814 RepID=UPI001CD6CE60|nr:hypothetical protein [Bradyrhizobium sp. NBAIM14]MCA1495420.1 hypothetical protein [Bradyrhizobium sp. NBAIM14]
MTRFLFLVSGFGECSHEHRGVASFHWPAIIMQTTAMPIKQSDADRRIITALRTRA